MSAPAVSVVIPTYNRRALVGQAVASVVAQTRRDFELIVVDDGSTDGTSEALERQVAGDARARIVRKANGGTASARNRGVEAARAPWTAFLDSDDLWEPGYLASQLGVLAEHPEGDMVLGDMAYRNQARAARTLFTDPDFRPPTSLDAMCTGSWGLPSSMVVRTEVARTLRFSGVYRIVEDTEFLLRFHVQGYACVLNPDCQAIWRRPEEQGAPSKTDAVHEASVEMLRLLEANRGLDVDRRAMARHIYASHRALAQRLVAGGRLSEARPHLLTWWRARPLRVRPLLLYLRSLVSRPTD